MKRALVRAGPLCQSRRIQGTAVAWRGKLAVLASGSSIIEIYDPDSGAWEVPIQLPAYDGSPMLMAAGSPAELYLVGRSGTDVAIYEYTFGW